MCTEVPIQFLPFWRALIDFSLAVDNGKKRGRDFMGPDSSINFPQALLHYHLLFVEIWRFLQFPTHPNIIIIKMPPWLIVWGCLALQEWLFFQNLFFKKTYWDQTHDLEKHHMHHPCYMWSFVLQTPQKIWRSAVLQGKSSFSSFRDILPSTCTTIKSITFCNIPQPSYSWRLVVAKDTYNP